MLRFFDLILSFLGLILGLPVFVFLIFLGWFDTGSPLFFQSRVGRNQKIFTLVKFRTMHLKTLSVATHLMNENAVTTFGKFLRKTKLDELPQLWNVLKGEMSLVGPRPCLPNQHELIMERQNRGVFAVRPGITGLAQINSIDMSTPKLLAETDASMIDNLTIPRYFQFILLTLVGRGAGDRLHKNKDQ